MEELKNNWISCKTLRSWGCICFEKQYRRIKEEAISIKNNYGEKRNDNSI